MKVTSAVDDSGRLEVIDLFFDGFPVLHAAVCALADVEKLATERLNFLQIACAVCCQPSAYSLSHLVYLSLFYPHRHCDSVNIDLDLVDLDQFVFLEDGR